ncbi:MAG: anti-sigma factor family protein [Planctomycetaceae bacterium]
MNENTQQPQPAPDPQENLVAYLDGELTEPAIREVEQQLAKNPTLRRNADAYQKAWELLDELPLVQATEQFTTKTVTSIKVDQLPRDAVTSVGTEAGSQNTSALPTVRTGQTRESSVNLTIPLGGKTAVNSRLTSSREPQPISAWPLATWFLGLALSAVGGYLITNRIVPSDAEMLLQDYPLIKNWDKYQEAGSLEFLYRYKTMPSGPGEMPPQQPENRGPRL